MKEKRRRKRRTRRTSRGKVGGRRKGEAGGRGVKGELEDACG